ncbi:hypothetical protein [Terriglobus roseus]|uniref:Uncharacterized protein n=1 Tax=Terriglobus roseus TaxID=392734 RepID=A0A1H4J4D7_9BACT|nr:hypothetical protein [Terriglobus roseus]SEB40412.1 hypothetical protein SAMN05443244_0307 [Terriglobus roseus]
MPDVPESQGAKSDTTARRSETAPELPFVAVFSWLVAIVIGLGPIVFAIVRWRTVIAYSNASMSWIEGHGPLAVLSYTLFTLLLPLPAHIGMVFVLYKTLFKRAGSDFRWIYSFLTYALVFSLYRAAATPLVKRLFPELVSNHEVFFRWSLQVQAVIFLAIVASAIYIFKQKALTTFGFTEVIVALVSNAALLSKVDLTTFPRVQMQSGSAVALIVFTYLLSRGIGDIFDGLNKLKTKHGDRVIQWFRAEASPVTSKAESQDPPA